MILEFTSEAKLNQVEQPWVFNFLLLTTMESRWQRQTPDMEIRLFSFCAVNRAPDAPVLRQLCDYVAQQVFRLRSSSMKPCVLL